MCECSSPDCSWCHGECRRDVAATLYMIDREDDAGTPMCEGCAEDALESGEFTEYGSVNEPILEE